MHCFLLETFSFYSRQPLLDSRGGLTLALSLPNNAVSCVGVRTSRRCCIGPLGNSTWVGGLVTGCSEAPFRLRMESLASRNASWCITLPRGSLQLLQRLPPLVRCEIQPARAASQPEKAVSKPRLTDTGLQIRENAAAKEKPCLTRP